MPFILYGTLLRMQSRRTLPPVVCALAAALLLGAPLPALASPTTVPLATGQAAPAGRASYLIDTRSGTVHAAEHADRRLPIASLTKVMTAYIALTHADLHDTVKITRQDVAYAVRGGGTSAYLRPGDRLTIKELLYGLMLPSGADAAHALARTLGPGVTAFTAKMNATARSLGMHDTHYVNADGLPTPSGDGYSTARDQAVLIRHALRIPAFTQITSTPTHSIPATAGHRAYTWTNTNRLLGTPGVIGVKTGFTRAAGYCLAFAAENADHTLIGVVLGSPTSSHRYQTARSLLTTAARA